MFTGIVEEIGTILNIKKDEEQYSILIKAEKIIESTKIGDSICTNGVCLTVTKMIEDQIEVDVMPETLRRTNLGELVKGSKVNLERALRLESRLGGHIVSGHIDGIGTIINIRKEDNAVWVQIQLDKEFLKYVVEKGSIAIDGISLTVAYVDEASFKVSIIPHTSKETILLTKTIGDKVNIECDILGKYIEKLFNHKANIDKKDDINKSFLIENGFI